MKKYLLLVALLSFTPVLKAAVNPPQDQQGHSIQNVDFVGALPCTFIAGGNNQANGSSPIVCGQSSTTISRGVVYGVIASSLATTAYLVFRDTVPGGPGVIGIGASTVAVVYNNTSYSTNTAAAATNIIIFPKPIQFLKGIAVNVDTALSGNVASWTILYRPINSNE